MSKNNCCTVTFCCCGCSLRTGTLIIGWLSLIGGILEAIANGNLGSHGCLACWGIFAIDMINIILALGLLYGAHKEVSTPLWIWVVATSILVTINIILGIIVTVITQIIIPIIIVAILSALQIYYIVVVRSAALRLDESKVSKITVLA